MMDVPSTGLHCESETNASPLIMETTESLSTREHTIDMIGSGDASSSSSSRVRDPAGSNLSQLEEERPSDSTHTPAAQTSNSSLSSNSRNSSSIRRGDPSRRSSPLNSGLWICLELVLTMSQIIAAIVVLSLSRNEHPHAPLAAWVVGYASGCVATLPLFYWRYLHRNQASEQDSVQARQGSSQINVSTGLFSLSVSRMSDGEERQTALPSPRSNQGLDLLRARLKVLVEYFKMALDCFFAVWFVVGNVWIFGGNSSATEAPNLYRLCIMFLTFSCIGYAMPFILCITICCCLPCIISVLGFREDLTHTRGASTESIDALPTYKFKMKKGRSGNDIEANSAVGEGGGVVAVGTEKERVISREDAVCCICLAKYSNNEELRELPCTHFFHKECVDKWLKINALCPLCKSEVGESLLGSLHSTSASQQHV